MRLFPVILVVFAVLPSAHADVADELAHMLAKHPEADANRDGKLTEDAEPGSYEVTCWKPLTTISSRARPSISSGVLHCVRAIRGVLHTSSPVFLSSAKMTDSSPLSRSATMISRSPYRTGDEP